jgi:hypothetical protein
MCDLETKREVSTEQGKKLAIEWGCPFMEVSAKERVSISTFVANDHLISRLITYGLHALLHVDFG